MKKRTILLALLVGFAFIYDSLSQKRSNERLKVDISSTNTTPKLVVGIVVDQMRYDYLTKFNSHFVEDGFNRLLNNGFNCKNHHFNYAPTKTAPGHAAVFSGASPKRSGIMGNSWFDRSADSIVYCVADPSMDPVGTSSDHGRKSPHRMQVSTITDQLRLHNQYRSKTISIAFKDRGSVLPGGFLANAAYWYYGEDEGKWISSSFYMDSLPKWVGDYNNSNAVEKYIKPWNTLKDIGVYVESGPDNTSYEGMFEGETAPIFPHDIPALWESNKQFDLLKYTPFSNSITTDFAMEAIKNENLGADSYTDFLTISYSGTDEIGHKFGINSKEVQDTYLRLDLDLERLFNYLDKTVGEGDYTVFLTADHGAVHVPAYLKDKNLQAGYFSLEEVLPSIKEYLAYKYGTEDLITGWYNDQIFLDQKIIENLDISQSEVQDALAAELRKFPEIEMVLTAHQLKNNHYLHGIAYLLSNGFNQKRSGDIYYVLKPGYLDYKKTGSDHGSPHEYDTHVPLLFYGSGIRKGGTFSRTEVTDIAPTIANLLGIIAPNGSMGNPIPEVLK